MLDHLMSWIQGFLKQHNRINAFDYVWCRLLQYTGFSVPSKTYQMIYNVGLLPAVNVRKWTVVQERS